VSRPGRRGLRGRRAHLTSHNNTGLGGTFTQINNPFDTNIGGLDTIPPQSVRGIDAEPRLAYDLSAVLTTAACICLH